MSYKTSILFKLYGLAKKSGCIRLLNYFYARASIIAYHRVNGYDEDSLTTPVPIFEEMLACISREYEVVSLESLVAKIKNQQPLTSRMIAVTFDDGYRDNLVYAAPILKKYAIPATFFITSGFINTNRKFPWDMDNKAHHPIMSWDEVKELRRLGFEIGGHTANHVDLGKVSLNFAEKEIFGCKEKIEDEIGIKVDKFAYPYGHKDAFREQVKPIVKKAGFTCCCCGYGGRVSISSDPFQLHRVMMYPSVIELMMDLDNFHTYYDGKMSFGSHWLNKNY